MSTASAGTSESNYPDPEDWDFDSGPGVVLGLQVLTDQPFSGYLELRSVSVDWEDEFGRSGSETMTEFAVGARAYLMDPTTMYGLIPYLAMDVAHVGGMTFGDYRASSGTDVGLIFGFSFRDSPTWSAEAQARLFFGGLDGDNNSLDFIGLQYDLAVVWWLGGGTRE